MKERAGDKGKGTAFDELPDVLDGTAAASENENNDHDTSAQPFAPYNTAPQPSTTDNAPRLTQVQIQALVARLGRVSADDPDLVEALWRSYYNIVTAEPIHHLFKYEILTRELDPTVPTNPREMPGWIAKRRQTCVNRFRVDLLQAGRAQPPINQSNMPTQPTNNSPAPRIERQNWVTDSPFYTMSMDRASVFQTMPSFATQQHPNRRSGAALTLQPQYLPQSRRINRPTQPQSVYRVNRPLYQPGQVTSSRTYIHPPFGVQRPRAVDRSSLITAPHQQHGTNTFYPGSTSNFLSTSAPITGSQLDPALYVQRETGDTNMTTDDLAFYTREDAATGVDWNDMGFNFDEFGNVMMPTTQHE